MIELSLPPLSSGRVWLSERPTIASVNARVISWTLIAERRVSTSKLGGVELFVPAGAVAHYALVCGHFVPNDLGSLTLQLPVSSVPGQHLPWALAAGVDEVRAGLPEEFAESVADALSTAPGRLGSGTLVLAPSAHAFVGSSASIFSRATAALVQVLALNPRDATEDIIRQILQSRRE